MTQRPPPWPDGARCAVAFTFDMDADSVVHAAHGARALDMPHALAQMRYDPLVGVPRLCDLFGSHGIPLTWFVPGWVAEQYPHAVDRVLSRGDEVAHHGHVHQPPGQQAREEEMQALEAGTRALARLGGRAPRGYRAPYYALSRHTLDLLIDAGFAYDSSLFADDVPILLDNGRGTLVELPVPASTDDYNQYVSSRAFDYLMKVSPPRQAMEVFQAEFDALWELGGLWVSVWHPAVSGRPAPALAIRSLIEHMQRRGGVWFARMEEIAAWARRVAAEGRWPPRVERVPFYERPVLERGWQA